MTVKEILKIEPQDIAKLKEKELRAVTTVLISAANKRIKRIIESDVYSEAYDRLRKSGRDKFSIKGKNYNQVSSEFAQVKKYLRQKTSSVSGSKAFVKRIQNMVQDKYGSFFSTNSISTLFNIYRNVVDEMPVLVFGYGSEQTQELITEYIAKDDMTSDDIEKNVMQDLKKWYEKQEDYRWKGDRDKNVGYENFFEF